MSGVGFGVDVLVSALNGLTNQVYTCDVPLDVPINVPLDVPINVPLDVPINVPLDVHLYVSVNVSLDVRLHVFEQTKIFYP